ncbi:hypothetical protein [Histidinibacterium aquaticum]|uniref:NADH-quinone oxidoreductase subunit E n=1 Tax=Histidinibacterium aquaticum TaxID=2613962 RepID=A0A5J5GNM0_9RHOB|nr:hypothetical protein [Histidinibacterium aquaticum]KAA9009740.1 hypothetical protein F3S47_00240 [Histidinibacterium aquaticum]
MTATSSSAPAFPGMIPATAMMPFGLPVAMSMAGAFAMQRYIWRMSLAGPMLALRGAAPLMRTPAAVAVDATPEPLVPSDEPDTDALHEVAQPGARSEPAPDLEAATKETPEGPHRPPGLDAPRGGVADDLTLLNGVGPKLAQQLRALGIHHFDQIAAWSEAEVAWIDENLEGPPGRASRGGWVEAASVLAEGQ